MGPVPLNFDSIFEYAGNNDDIEISYQEFSNGGIGEAFSPGKNRKFNASMFTEDELNCMEAVVSRFKRASTDDIIKLSHEEQAWSENFGSRRKISYNYTFKLVHL